MGTRMTNVWSKGKVLKIFETWGPILGESLMMRVNLKGLSDYTVYRFIKIMDYHKSSNETHPPIIPEFLIIPAFSTIHIKI